MITSARKAHRQPEGKPYEAQESQTLAADYERDHIDCRHDHAGPAADLKIWLESQPTAGEQAAESHGGASSRAAAVAKLVQAGNPRPSHGQAGCLLIQRHCHGAKAMDIVVDRSCRRG